MASAHTPVNLNRSLGLNLAIILVIGNIIGSGVYKKVAPMASEVDSAWMVLVCWVCGGVLSLFGALSSAELAGMFADTGGEYVYFRKIYNRFFAFMYGWSSYSIIKTGTAASLAYIFAQSLHSIYPLPDVLPTLADINILGIVYPFANLNVKLMACFILLFLTILNTYGIKAGANLSTVLLGMVLLGILIIVVFGFGSDQSSLSRLTEHTSVSFGASAFLTAMLSAFFAYEGWNAVGFVAGEIKDPHRNIPVSLAVGVFAVMVLYLLANTAYLTLLSIDELHAIYASQNKIAAVEAVRSFWGNTGALAISFLILLTTLGCLHASVISSSRIYFAMALDKLFFEKVDKVNKYQVPGVALWFQCLWASVLILSGTFDQITDMAMFAAFIFYGAMALGVIIMRIREPNRPRPYKVWGYPIVPAIFVLFCSALVLNAFITRPREVGIALMLIMIGLPFYFYFKRKSPPVK